MTLRQRLKGEQQTSKLIQVQAPTGGLNRIDPIGNMPPGDCTLLSNLVAAEYGLRSRLGSAEWVTGLTGTNTNTVRCIMSYDGTTGHSADKVFATTDRGIYDVTSSGAAIGPSGATLFGIVDGTSGYGSYANFVDANGNHKLLYCDESNGYFVYDAGGGTWTKVSQGAGASQIAAPADPTKFVQVCLFASRVWFVEKNTTRAWYLGVFGGPALFGTAQPFDFGPYFRQGGYLVGLYNWTIDGSTSGITNRLVAISSSGDIVIFQGIDPSLAVQWSIVGQWNVGSMPAGRDLATTFGGDLLVLSTLGVLPLSRLVVGNPIVDRTQYATYKITNLFNALMSLSSGQLGWHVRLNPQDNTMIINVPAAGLPSSGQLVMSMTNRSWTQYTGLDIASSAVSNGVLFFGTSDGRVMRHTNYIDNVKLSNGAYSSIPCSLLTSFQMLEGPVKKNVQFIRPWILAQGVQPNLSVSAKYDFDLSVPGSPATPTGNPGGAVWDTALWDSALWQSDYVITTTVAGSSGMGVYVAIGLTFSAVARTIISGFDVAYESGGFL